MKNKEERIFRKKMLDCVDSFVYNNKQSKAEENRLKRTELDLRERELDFQERTKDRVDIPLKKYEGMKEHIDHLTRKNYHYEEIFERLRINEIIDKIDPATIEVSTMKDQMRLSTRVNIQFECKCLIEQDLNSGKETTQFERFLKRN